MMDDPIFSYRRAQQLRWVAITMNLLLAGWHVSKLDWSILVAIPHLLVVWFMYSVVGKTLREQARQNAIRKLIRGRVRYGD